MVLIGVGKSQPLLKTVNGAIGELGSVCPGLRKTGRAIDKWASQLK